MYQQFMEIEKTENGESVILSLLCNEDEEIIVIKDKKIIASYPSWYDDNAQYINECNEIMFIENGLIDAIINDGQYNDELNERGIYNLMVYIYKHKEV